MPNAKKPIYTVSLEAERWLIKDMECHKPQRVCIIVSVKSYLPYSLDFFFRKKSNKSLCFEMRGISYNCNKAVDRCLLWVSIRFFFMSDARSKFVEHTTATADGKWSRKIFISYVVSLSWVLSSVQWTWMGSFFHNPLHFLCVSWVRDALLCIW